MTPSAERPEGLRLVRTTRRFTELTVPAGLLASHRIATGVWGRLVVHSGSLTFEFEEGPEDPISLTAGEAHDIPPQRPHHLVIDSPVTFQVEFYK